METLAYEIYNNLLDMDYIDYSQTNEAELEDLLNDLKLLEQQGSGTLLNAINILIKE